MPSTIKGVNGFIKHKHRVRVDLNRPTSDIGRRAECLILTHEGLSDWGYVATLRETR